MTDRELMQMALDALEAQFYTDGRTIKALRDRLAQPEPEPVAIGEEWKPCVKLPIVVHVREQRKGETHVSTREGITPVKEDDLIMRGVAGEEYPIGRELFNSTYTFDTAPVHAIDISQERVNETAKDQHELVKLRRGDILRCIETEELCTVWATSTSGKTLVTWGGNDFTEYTAEQIGELFWLEPESSEVEIAAEQSDNYASFLAGVRFARANLFAPPKREWVGLTDEEIESIWGESIDCMYSGYYNAIKDIEAKLKEKNT